MHASSFGDILGVITSTPIIKPGLLITMSVRITCLLSVALLGAAIATPTIAKKTQAPKGPTLIWRGDVATANGVVKEVSEAWEKAGHGSVELQPFNTASGLDAVANGTADLAGSARGSDGSAQNGSLTFTPVAWGAVVLITQASNPISSISLKQVHDIYYGKIHNWSEIGGRDAPIDVYAVASPGDGVEFSLRQLLFGRGNQPVAAPRLYVNTRKLEEGIALNPNGFGAGTLVGARDNSKLKAIPIDGKAPTPANIADGSYPLFIPLYMVTNPTSPKAADAQAFVDFMKTEPAKAALRNRGVIPYEDGSVLAQMDANRRSAILAAVGAKASRPVSAPGATYASRSAIAPTSPDTVAARSAMVARTAATEQEAAIKRVEGSVSGTTVSSVAAVDGAATTVSTGKGSDFGQVTADASQTSASTQTYTVSKGDTLSSIASKHSVQVSELRTWNHLKSDQIQLGQVLRVSNR